MRSRSHQLSRRSDEARTPVAETGRTAIMSRMVTLDQGGAGRPHLVLRPTRGRAARLAELSWTQRAVAPSTAGGEAASAGGVAGAGRAAGPGAATDAGAVPDAGAAAGSAAPGAWRIVPDAHPHVIHHRMRDGRSSTALVGARSHWIDVDQSERAFTVGLRLRPGTVPLLLGIDGWELRDRSVPVQHVLGGGGDELAERLAVADDPADVEAALLEFLAAWDEDEVDWRVRGFLAFATARPRGLDGCTVRAAARELGVGERSLRDTCRASLGLRPKEAHRILRLHAAIEAGLAGVADAAVAETAGYADQAHLIRESNALVGETPEAFRARGYAPFTNQSKPISPISYGSMWPPSNSS